MPQPIVVSTHLSKEFDLNRDRRRSVKSSVIRIIGRKPKDPPRILHALNDVSFDVMRGDVLGVIGENGTGKSTLLKIVAGIMVPTSGAVSVSGSVAGLLEIGLGFNPELTGRENVHLYGSILGLTRRDLNGKMQDIVKFAELEEFLDIPLKKYSSGMQMRLAFAVAMNVNADVYLLDEVFSVGDERFQKKSFDYLQSTIKGDKAVLLVSHDRRVILELCNKAVLLRRDAPAVVGDVAHVLSEYKSYITI